MLLACRRQFPYISGVCSNSAEREKVLPTDSTLSRSWTSGPGTGFAAALTRDVGKLHPVVWLYLLAVVIPVGFNVGSLALTGLRLMLMITVVPMTIRLFSGAYGKVYPVDYLFFLHIAWASIAVGVNNPDRALENVGSMGVEFFGGYLVGRAYIRSAADLIGLIRALLLLVLISLPFAIVEAFRGTAIIPDLIARIPGLTTVAQVDIEKRMGLHRVQAFFAHPIHYGLFCSTALALTFVGLRTVMSKGGRLLGCAAVSLGVFMSLSSGALLAAVLQFGLIAWDSMLRNVERRWLVLLGLFAAMYVAVDLLSNRTPIKVLMSYATFSVHTAYYRSIIFEWGMINVWDNPIFGLGLRDWVRPSYMRSGSMDNFWLVMAVRYGIPGFLMIALGYADALFRVGRRKLTPGTTQSDLRLGWMIMFLGLSFTLVTVHVWTSVYSFVFFLLASGLWIASANDEDNAGDTGPASGSGSRRRGAGPVLARGLVEASPSGPQASRSRSRTALPHTRTELDESAAPTREGPVFTRFPARHGSSRPDPE